MRNTILCLVIAACSLSFGSAHAKAKHYRQFEVPPATMQECFDVFIYKMKWIFTL